MNNKVMIEELDSFLPDWSDHYTLSRLQSELGINFDEPGWYLNNGDSMLITKVYANENIYRVHVYNGRDPRETIKKVAELPVQMRWV